MVPRLACAPACPFAAALRYHIAASRSLLPAPTPSAARTPSRFSASGKSLSAAARPAALVGGLSRRLRQQDTWSPGRTAAPGVIRPRPPGGAGRAPCGPSRRPCPRRTWPRGCARHLPLRPGRQRGGSTEGLLRRQLHAKEPSRYISPRRSAAAAPTPVRASLIRPAALRHRSGLWSRLSSPHLRRRKRKPMKPSARGWPFPAACARASCFRIVDLPRLPGTVLPRQAEQLIRLEGSLPGPA